MKCGITTRTVWEEQAVYGKPLRWEYLSEKMQIPMKRSYTKT